MLLLRLSNKARQHLPLRANLHRRLRLRPLARHPRHLLLVVMPTLPLLLRLRVDMVLLVYPNLHPDTTIS